MDPRGDVLPTEAGPTWTLRTMRCSSNVKRTHDRRALSNVDRPEDTHGAHPAVRPYGVLRRQDWQCDTPPQCNCTYGRFRPVAVLTSRSQVSRRGHKISDRSWHIHGVKSGSKPPDPRTDGSHPSPWVWRLGTGLFTVYVPGAVRKLVSPAADLRS